MDTHDTGRGVAVEDFDRDGYLDIVTGGIFNDVRYYRNVAGERFEDRTTQAGLANVRQPFIITAADVDNDGWVDLFIGRPFQHFLLFRNSRDGTFSDITADSGLLRGLGRGELAASWVPAWGDVDNDGDLDLFLAQWGLEIPFYGGLLSRPKMDSKLFVNDGGRSGEGAGSGNGVRFVDRTEAFGLESFVDDQFLIGAAFGDYDGDGYTDLFLSNPFKRSSGLFRNVGGEKFELTDLVSRSEGGFSAAFIDVNHDGRLDIFWPGTGDATSITEQVVFANKEYETGHTTLLVQGEDGRFAAAEDLFDMAIGTMGASYGDLNNDGLHDFYLGTGNPEAWFVLPNLMYMGVSRGNDWGGRLDNVSMLQGFGMIQKGHGIVFFDFDNDGDQDVYSSLGGMWPGDAWPNQLFVNDSISANSWVKIRLRGRQTNRFGVGCRVRVKAGAADGSTIVRTYHMDNKTGFGSAPYLAHIGLMQAVAVQEVEVSWPGSQTTRVYEAQLGRLNILDESRGVELVASASPAGR